VRCEEGARGEAQEAPLHSAAASPSGGQWCEHCRPDPAPVMGYEQWDMSCEGKSHVPVPGGGTPLS
jgi:hypothetical protein